MSRARRRRRSSPRSSGWATARDRLRRHARPASRSRHHRRTSGPGSTRSAWRLSISQRRPRSTRAPRPASPGRARVRRPPDRRQRPALAHDGGRRRPDGRAAPAARAPRRRTRSRLRVGSDRRRPRSCSASSWPRRCSISGSRESPTRCLRTRARSSRVTRTTSRPRPRGVHRGVARRSGPSVRCRTPTCDPVTLIVPSAQLLTADARAALPDVVPLADAVFNLAHAALLVEALTTDPELLAGRARGPDASGHAARARAGGPDVFDELQRAARPGLRLGRGPVAARAPGRARDHDDCSTGLGWRILPPRRRDDGLRRSMAELVGTAPRLITGGTTGLGLRDRAAVPRGGRGRGDHRPRRGARRRGRAALAPLGAVAVPARRRGRSRPGARERRRGGERCSAGSTSW